MKDKLFHEQQLFAWAGKNCERVWDFSVPRGQDKFSRATLFVPLQQNGDLIIMAHATGNDRFFPLYGLLILLLKAGHSVVTFDLDGHGRQSTSLLGEEEPTTMLEALIEKLVPEIHPSRWHFCGQSLGAALGIEFASRHPRQFCKMALVAPPMAPLLSLGFVVAEARTIVKPSYWQTRSEYGFLGLIPSFGPVRRQTFPVRILPSLAAQGYLRLVKSIIASCRLEAMAPKIKSSVLMLNGEDDHLVRLSDQGDGLWPKENWRFVSFAKLNHYEMLFNGTVSERVGSWFQQD